MTFRFVPRIEISLLTACGLLAAVLMVTGCQDAGGDKGTKAPAGSSDESSTDAATAEEEDSSDAAASADDEEAATNLAPAEDTTPPKTDGGEAKAGEPKFPELP